MLNPPAVQKGAKITLVIWLAAVIAISLWHLDQMIIKENTEEGSVGGDNPSEIAVHIKEEAFPSDEGLTTLIVFHNDKELNSDDREKISNFSEWISSDDKPEM